MASTSNNNIDGKEVGEGGGEGATTAPLSDSASSNSSSSSFLSSSLPSTFTQQPTSVPRKEGSSGNQNQATIPSIALGRTLPMPILNDSPLLKNFQTFDNVRNIMDNPLQNNFSSASPSLLGSMNSMYGRRMPAGLPLFSTGMQQQPAAAGAGSAPPLTTPFTAIPAPSFTGGPPGPQSMGLNFNMVPGQGIQSALGAAPFGFNQLSMMQQPPLRPALLTPFTFSYGTLQGNLQPPGPSFAPVSLRPPFQFSPPQQVAGGGPFRPILRPELLALPPRPPMPMQRTKLDMLDKDVKFLEDFVIINAAKHELCSLTEIDFGREVVAIGHISFKLGPNSSFFTDDKPFKTNLVELFVNYGEDKQFTVRPIIAVRTDRNSIYYFKKPHKSYESLFNDFCFAITITSQVFKILTQNLPTNPQFTFNQLVFELQKSSTTKNFDLKPLVPFILTQISKLENGLFILHSPFYQQLLNNANLEPRQQPQTTTMMTNTSPSGSPTATPTWPLISITEGRLESPDLQLLSTTKRDFTSSQFFRPDMQVAAHKRPKKYDVARPATYRPSTSPSSKDVKKPALKLQKVDLLCDTKYTGKLLEVLEFLCNFGAFIHYRPNNIWEFCKIVSDYKVGHHSFQPFSDSPLHMITKSNFCELARRLFVYIIYKYDMDSMGKPFNETEYIGHYSSTPTDPLVLGEHIRQLLLDSTISDKVVCRSLDKKDLIELNVDERILVLSDLVNEMLQCKDVIDSIDQLAVTSNRAGDSGDGSSDFRRSKKQGRKGKHIDTDLESDSVIVSFAAPRVANLETSVGTEELLSKRKQFRISPLGCDKSNRIYWIFGSIPGLFIQSVNDKMEEAWYMVTNSKKFQELISSLDSEDEDEKTLINLLMQNQNFILENSEELLREKPVGVDLILQLQKNGDAFFRELFNIAKTDLLHLCEDAYYAFEVQLRYRRLERSSRRETIAKEQFWPRSWLHNIRKNFEIAEGNRGFTTMVEGFESLLEWLCTTKAFLEKEVEMEVIVLNVAKNIHTIGQLVLAIRYISSIIDWRKSSSTPKRRLLMLESILGEQYDEVNSEESDDSDKFISKEKEKEKMRKTEKTKEKEKEKGKKKEKENEKEKEKEQSMEPEQASQEMDDDIDELLVDDTLFIASSVQFPTPPPANTQPISISSPKKTKKNPNISLKYTKPAKKLKK